VTQIGYNYRLDEIRSALGLNQLNRLDDFLHRRREVYQWYVEELKEVKEIHLPFQHLAYPEVGHHIFPVRLKNHDIRSKLQEALKEQGIQTSIHYPAIHLFSAYDDYKNAECPITEQISESELTLPFYPSMTQDDVIMVCDAIKKWFKQLGNTHSS
jgi:dTDP-4-amino-4,6-dideoxygalactose transaminase